MTNNYNRKQAVAYADEWWNKRNPDFPIFEVDCTNYVSQCLLAGGAKMWGNPDRLVGWWYNQEAWSLSWSVAHSLYWYLKGGAGTLDSIEIESANDLEIGDIICYDFAGDKRYDHTTIVTDKTNDGSPLVNAHTDNSYHRRWEYQDSAAWTPQIQYAFFHIPS